MRMNGNLINTFCIICFFLSKKVILCVDPKSFMENFQLCHNYPIFLYVALINCI